MFRQEASRRDVMLPSVQWKYLNWMGKDRCSQQSYVMETVSRHRGPAAWTNESVNNVHATNKDEKCMWFFAPFRLSYYRTNGNRHLISDIPCRIVPILKLGNIRTQMRMHINGGHLCYHSAVISLLLQLTLTWTEKILYLCAPFQQCNQN